MTMTMEIKKQIFVILELETRIDFDESMEV